MYCIYESSLTTLYVVEPYLVILDLSEGCLRGQVLLEPRVRINERVVYHPVNRGF